MKRRLAMGSSLLGCLAFTLACQTTSLPHRWTNANYGYEVASGLPRLSVRLLLEQSVDEKLRALCPIFAVENLRGVRVFIHDATAPTHGDGKIRGFHRRGQIHIFARFQDGRLKMPAPHAQATIAHEMVHALASRAGLKIDRWMEEGLAEVFATSKVGSNGRVTLWFHDQHERTARNLKGSPDWLSADQLLAVKDSYPEANRMRALYAQSASFVAHLLEVGDDADLDTSSVRARLQAMLDLSREELLASFATWQRQLSRVGFLERLTKLAATDDSRIKELVAGSMGDPGGLSDKSAEAWWRLLARLLTDDEERVRTATRLRLSLPRPSDRGRFASWRNTSDRNLRLMGLVCLALIGDRDAAIEMLAAIRGPQDLEWWQPLIWLTMKWNPEAAPELSSITVEPERFVPWCRASIRTIRGKAARRQIKAPEQGG